MSDGQWTDDRSTDTEEREEVQFATTMPRQLREDAKKNTSHGELSDEVRQTFRRLAYGPSAADGATELDRLEAELREIRLEIDDLRNKRGRIDNQIQNHEARANRLEERISALERARGELDTKVETLESMLLDGDRWWPVRIKNAANVDISTAEDIHARLQEMNPELPMEAFREPAVHEEIDWRRASDWTQSTGSEEVTL